MGGHGACYLIRRAAWQSIPADTINDDFMLPMGIVANGWRAVYDADLEVTELEKTGSRQEFRRRMRIGAGNMQQSLRLWRLADPRRGWLAFVFVSGKGARPFMPFIMIAAMIALAVLAVRGSLLAAVGYVTAVTLLAATALAITLRLRRLPRPVLWFVYLVEGYTASLVGAVKYLVGQRVAGWQPSGTPRPAVRVDPSAGPSP
jgi:cellulose synthase/poly-beta-1,6-N-acetylglucosamine synthase-like glycosyltransferase